MPHTELTDAPLPDLLITGEVAAILHVTPAAVRKMERTGKLLAHRTPSGVRLFRRDDVLIEKRRRALALTK